MSASRTRLSGALFVIWAGLSVPALASAQAATFRGELLRDWRDMESTLTALAEAMPEDKYTFKTTAAQRDFAQQVLHVATANVLNLRFLGGEQPAPVIDRNARMKADVLKALHESFDYGAALIQAQTDDSILDVVQTNAFLGPSTRARVLYFLLGHSWDIYGQMVVYVRLNGGVPPASARP
jgi:uncharacterized damage-inducible protein DinB